MAKSDTPKGVKCSFCGKTQDSVRKIVAGPGVYICNECIGLCNEIIESEYCEEDEDTLFEEYMATTEELGFELEEYLPEDSIMDFKAYKWEPSDNDIKGVLVMANEELGNNKLKDVMKRLLTQVE